MKSFLLLFVFSLFYCSTYSQSISENEVIHGQRDYYLCYIKSDPTIDTVNKDSPIFSVLDNVIKNDTVFSIIKIQVKVLDIYYSKKYYELMVLTYRALHNDSLPENIQLPLSNKTLNIVIVSDKKRVLKKFKKLYSKKQLFVIAPPFELNDNLLLIDENRYNYFFLKEFDYFDQLIRIE